MSDPRILSEERLNELRRWFDKSPLDDMQAVFAHIDALTEELQTHRDWGHPDQRCLWGELETEYGLDGEDMDCAADVKDAMVSVLKSLTEERDRLKEQRKVAFIDQRHTCLDRVIDGAGRGDYCLICRADEDAIARSMVSDE